MLDAIKCIVGDNIVRQDSVKVHLDTRQSNCCSAKLSTSLLLSYGPVTDQN